MIDESVFFAFVLFLFLRRNKACKGPRDELLGQRYSVNSPSMCCHQVVPALPVPYIC